MSEGSTGPTMQARQLDFNWGYQTRHAEEPNELIKLMDESNGAEG